MDRKIVIYKDEGVSEFGPECLMRFFAGHTVQIADAQSLIDGAILKGADLFIMPGGADLPYCRKLNGIGNANIRTFVENGGTYLGICAGAYYGCSALEFHKGRKDEISGPRELSLTDAIAYGSLSDLAPYYDLTLTTANAAKIVTNDRNEHTVFYHGGPAFRLPEDSGTTILARYAGIHGRPPAIIENRVGKGRALLLGVHLEMNADNLRDYPIKDEAERPHLNNIIEAMHGTDTHALLRKLLRND